MATVTPTQTQFQIDHEAYTWALTTANADGGPCRFQGSGDRTFQVTGNFGSGGTIVLQGSLDGSNWFTLSKPDGAAASFTTSGLTAVTESPIYIRPFVSAGTGVSVTAILAIRRNDHG